MHFLINYISQGLSAAEKIYSTFILETPDIMYGYQQCCYFLFGCEFHIETDNTAVVKYLNDPSEVMDTVLICWIGIIKTNIFTVSHKPGNKNYWAN